MRQKYKTINTLKVIFALGIVYGHYIGNLVSVSNQDLPLLVNIIWALGGMVGNSFFFITSGFLIASNYKHKINDLSFGQFWGGRIKKLMPYFLFGVTLDIIVVFIDKCLMTDLFGNMSLSFERIILSYMLLFRGISNDVSQYYNGSLWFMCCLAYAYVLYFFLAKYTKEHYYTWSALFLFIFMLKGLISKIDTLMFPTPLIRTMTFFLTGLLLYEFYERYKSKLLSLICGIVSMVICLLSLILSSKNVLGDAEITIGLFILPSIILMTLNFEVLNKLLSNHIMQLLAKYTTALYITHGPVINFIHILGRYVTRHMNYNVRYDTMTCFIVISGIIFIVAGITEKFLNRYW